MDLNAFLLGFAVLACVYMACNIGANDVANAMGTSVGSKTLTFKQAIMVAALAEFLGAVFVGGHVSETVRKGMVEPSVFSDQPLHLVYGMIAALVASAIWLHIASYLGWPVSTTHAIVGAIVGFGVLAGGIDAVSWGKVGKVIASWFISPFLGAMVSYLLFRFVSARILETRNPLLHAKRNVPYLVFLVLVILAISMVYKGLKNLHMDLPFSQAMIISLFVGVFGFIVTKKLVSRVETIPPKTIPEQYAAAEHIFKFLQVFTAFYVAFAHGSNDVANAVGPLATVVATLEGGVILATVEMPLWILVLGASCIVIGLMIWGRKVMETIGKKITEITPSRGFCAEFGAATVVLICSKMGLPVSTTHTLVGAVIGVGLARGLATLNVSIVKKIFLSWLYTVPFSAVLAMIIFKIFVSIF